MNRGYLLFVLSLMTGVSHADWQPDRFSLAYGQFFSPLVNRHAEIGQYRLSLAWDLSHSLWTSDILLLQSYAELAFSRWNSTLNPIEDSRRIGAESATQVSLTPVFRLTSTNPMFCETSPFFDFGVGVSYQSEEDIEQQHLSGINMGGNWQFEIRAMVGLTLGNDNPFEVSYGWMHYSNANLNSDNEGLDFQTLQMTYRF